MNNIKPLFSIIIPCYNCENFLSRAVESVLSQQCQDWELILVNNNSTDATQVVIDNYVSNYPNKIFTFFQTKKGAPAARNLGMQKSKANWLQFLDADDVLLESKLENQIEIAIKTNADLVCGNTLVCNGLTDEVVWKREVDNKNLWESLVKSALGITSGNLWRKNSVIKAGAWNENLTSSQEYDLMFRMLKMNFKFAFDFDYLTKIYQYENSISHSTDKKRQLEISSNRLNLRLKIKHYLYSKKMLSERIEWILDRYIYIELFNLYNNEPQKLIKKFIQLKLKVPFHFKLRIYLRPLIKLLKIK